MPSLAVLGATGRGAGADAPAVDQSMRSQPRNDTEV
jgi:hypothetical protein